MSKKIYARQIPPENQESPLMICGFPDFDEYYKDVTIDGNKNFVGYRTGTFKKILAGLESVGADLLEMSDKNQAPEAIAETIHDAFPPEHKQKYGPGEIEGWLRIFKDHENAGESHNAICQALELMTGKPYKYRDPKAETRLECHADTLVAAREASPYIAAIRLGGYPESVKGMSDAIYGGGTVSLTANGREQPVRSLAKQYGREYGHDGLYAEALLVIKDEQHQSGIGEDGDANGEGAAPMPRKCYIFCGIDDPVHLYEEIDKRPPCRCFRNLGNT